MSVIAQRNILTASLVWASAMTCMLFFLLSHPAVHWSQVADSPAPIAMAPAATAAMAMDTPSQQMDAPLAPMQLTAEQMQNIGMTTGTAEYKDLSDDLRATGSVAINDSLLSYVQVDFPAPYVKSSRMQPINMSEKASRSLPYIARNWWLRSRNTCLRTRISGP